MANPFLPLPAGLTITNLEQNEGILSIRLLSLPSTATCPLCGCPSERIHSRYNRTLTDLPICGQQVQLMIAVRRFFCDQPACSRKVFVERLPELTRPWARMTNRLVSTLQKICLATNGEGGARLASHFGVMVSPTTLLRRIMMMPTPSTDPVEILGVDDFSFRRGRTFGTILVNLATHQIIDLLPDRSAATTAQWMRQHPEIRVVSRDRGTDYALAAREGAPQAVQIADRFHLMHNLVDAIDPLIARCLKEIRHHQRALVPDAERQLPPSHTEYEATRLARLAYNQARFDQVMELHRQHCTYHEIAQQLRMTERTVRRWIARGACPDGRRRRKRWRPRNHHESYVRQRWGQGCHEVAVLYQELHHYGFTGTQRTVYRYVQAIRQELDVTPVPSDLHVRRIVWLMVQSPATLTPEQHTMLATLRRINPRLDRLYILVQSFGQMVRQHEGYQLDVWIHQVRESSLAEMQRFAAGLLKDKDAVVAGLTEKYSNGMVEGFVNKLKLIKRAMYGQAGFALLRQRTLSTS